MARSALVEAVAQLTRALDQIATLPSTPRLRREQIKLQVATITPLMHVKGYAAPEVKAAAERARLLIEQAEALGEAPEDPLLLFSVLYGFWITNVVAFNGDAALALAGQFLGASREAGGICSTADGTRPYGVLLVGNGKLTQSLRQTRSSSRALRSCCASSAGNAFWPRHSGDEFVPRSLALWLLGYPDAALAEAEPVPEGGARRLIKLGRLLCAEFLACGAFPLRSVRDCRRAGQ